MPPPSWGSRHGLYDVDIGDDERPPADIRSADRPPGGRGPECPPVSSSHSKKHPPAQGRHLLGHRNFSAVACARAARDVLMCKPESRLVYLS